MYFRIKRKSVNVLIKMFIYKTLKRNQLNLSSVTSFKNESSNYTDANNSETIEITILLKEPRVKTFQNCKLSVLSHRYYTNKLNIKII